MVFRAITGCLQYYPHFKKHYKLITIDLRKQQAFDSDPKAIEQVTFTGKLDTAAGATMFFTIEEAKEHILDFSKQTVRIL